MNELIGETCWVESVGPGYDRVPFVLNAGTDVRLYEFLIVRDGRREYYGRVVAGEERSEDATPERLRREKAMYFNSGPRRDDDFMLVRTQHLEILGQIVRRQDGTLHVVEPDFLPEVKAQVVRPDDTELERLVGVPANGYPIGRAMTGRELDFRLHRLAPVRNIGNFGRPGTGKSHLAAVLLEEFVDDQLPVISFDVFGELMPAVNELGGVNLVPGRDFRIPIRVLDSYELLTVAPHLTREQEAVVVDGFTDLREDPAQTDTFELGDLMAQIQAVAMAQGQGPVGNRAALKIGRLRGDSLLGDNLGSLRPVQVREPESWARLFRIYPCINIFVGHLGGRRREIVVAGVCRLLQQLRRDEKVPPFVLILDEAHFFVPSGSRSTSTDVVRDFIRTGRHGPVGTVLVSQSPAGIDRQILLLLNTIFAFALTGDDLRTVSDFLADAPQELVRRVPLMRTGTAVVGAAKDLVRHALLVRVRERRTTHGAPTVDLAREAARWRDSHPSDGDDASSGSDEQ